jgi:3-oxoacyl-[acyl-carrier protein] reductase
MRRSEEFVSHAIGRLASNRSAAMRRGFAASIPRLVTRMLAVANFTLPVATLDVLVCAQGITLYKRAEFEMAGFRRVMDVNLMSVMAVCTRFKPMVGRTSSGLLRKSRPVLLHNPARHFKTQASGTCR